MTIGDWLPVVVCLWLLAVSVQPAHGEEPGSTPDSDLADCRYERDPQGSDGTFEHTLLPPGSLFRPTIADMKQPRFSASLRRVHIESGVLAQQRSGETFSAGLVGFGSTFGLYGYRDGHCNGVQIGIAGGVFSQFNLNTLSLNLINSDFTVGLPVTMRWRSLSARLRVYHQSSHLGDEFLLANRDVTRINLWYEAVDLTVAYGDDWWRVYAGGGYLFRRTRTVEPWMWQGGVEVRSSFWHPNPTPDTEVQAVAGVDVESFETRGWGLTTSAKGGLEAATGAPNARRIRLMVVFLRGFMPFGQFFREEKLTNWGGELQFEF